MSVSVVFEKMEREEFRAVKAELDEVHEESSSLKTVYFWINEFKRGRTTTKDEAPDAQLRSPHRIWWKKLTIWLWKIAESRCMRFLRL